ncbi:hypothetical protein ACO0LF_27180 [Undibacterium sp. Di27W]|uniref:hypothetical protein n=1 Tax=Undibacterium sp. Di27W TaxID=3413036 RepID=UPI003BEFCCD1
MSDTNFAIVENIEHGDSYGILEYELLYALKNSSNLIMLKIVTREASLWSIFTTLFFWEPLLRFLALYPALVILLFIARNFVDIPTPVISQHAVLLAYVISVWLTLRKQTPMQDYRSRKQHVGTKTLHLDFVKQVMVAEEVYLYFPEKNRLWSIALKDLQAWALWHEDDKRFQEDGDRIDSLNIHIRPRHVNDLDMHWVRKKLGDPIFYHLYDKNDAAETALAKKKFDEVMAMLSAHQIFKNA